MDIRSSFPKLNDWELAYLLLRHLCQLHSLGGVSLGRSYRSGLLEAAMRIYPIDEERKTQIYEFAEELALHLEEEWMEVPPVISQQKQLRLFVDDFCWCGNRTLARLLLYEMWRWYQQDAKDNELPLFDEMALAERIMPLLEDEEDVSGMRALAEGRELIQEARDRIWLRDRDSWDNGSCYGV